MHFTDARYIIDKNCSIPRAPHFFLNRLLLVALGRVGLEKGAGFLGREGVRWRNTPRTKRFRATMSRLCKGQIEKGVNRKCLK